MIEVFGLKFKGINKNAILSHSNEMKFVVTVNSEFIVEAHKDQSFKDIINLNYSTFDGQIPYILAKWKVNAQFEKISGSDLIFDVLKLSSKNRNKVFLLGDTNEVNQNAVTRARSEFDSDCFGFSPQFEPYPFSKSLNNEIINMISSVRPYYLFVAFGAKKQEMWINEHREILERLGVKLVVGCGGSISFLSQKVSRAPLIVQKMGMEGIYRFIQEPKLFRLKRIFKSFLVFKYIW